FPQSNGKHRCYLTTRTVAPPTRPVAASDNTLANILKDLAHIILPAVNVNPELLSTLNTAALEGNLKVETKRGFAHTILTTAEPPPLRAKGLEIAFDATNDAYLAFMDEALQIFDNQYANNSALGGYVSMRFVGPSRAYLSPQYRFARTCMVEFVGLRDLTRTQPILDLLEDAARKHGGIQH